MIRRKSKKIGRNDLCWCGSGKKYKRCHLGREAQPELGRQEAINRYIKRSRKGQCLHPYAGPKTCSGRVIEAHTIQRNAGLNHIARDGHVGSFLIHPSKLPRSRRDVNSEAHRVGIGEASTFNGFCSRHDNELFAPIDDRPFEGDVEQIMLLGYRAVCHELHSKRFAFDLDQAMRDFDRGTPAAFQHAYQHTLSTRDSGIEVSINELTDAKELYEASIIHVRPAVFSHFVVFFDRRPDLLCSGIWQATHDFRGRRIFDLADLTIPASWLAFALIVSGEGGAAVFSCPSSHEEGVKVLTTLDELSDDELPHAIVRFAFEFFENTYFSLDWWDGLEEPTRAAIKRRQLTESDMGFGRTEYPRRDDCLLDDGIRAVDWEVNSKIASFGGAVVQALGA